MDNGSIAIGCSVNCLERLSWPNLHDSKELTISIRLDLNPCSYHIGFAVLDCDCPMSIRIQRVMTRTSIFPMFTRSISKAHRFPLIYARRTVAKHIHRSSARITGTFGRESPVQPLPTLAHSQTPLADRLKPVAIPQPRRCCVHDLRVHSSSKWEQKLSRAMPFICSTQTRNDPTAYVQT